MTAVIFLTRKTTDLMTSLIFLTRKTTDLITSLVFLIRKTTEFVSSVALTGDFETGRVPKQDKVGKNWKLKLRRGSGKWEKGWQRQRRDLYID